MRKKEATAQAAEPKCDCMCMGVGPRLTELLQCRSQAAAGHLQNARVEFLKGMRALIDERIEHLSRAQRRRGTQVPVE